MLRYQVSSLAALSRSSSQKPLMCPPIFLAFKQAGFRVWQASSLADKTRAWVKVADVDWYSCKPEVLGGAAGAAQQAGRLTVLQMGHSAQPG